jgi:hypothetical protein
MLQAPRGQLEYDDVSKRAPDRSPCGPLRPSRATGPRRRPTATMGTGAETKAKKQAARRVSLFPPSSPVCLLEEDRGVVS